MVSHDRYISVLCCHYAQTIISPHSSPTVQSACVPMVIQSDVQVLTSIGRFQNLCQSCTFCSWLKARIDSIVCATDSSILASRLREGLEHSIQVGAAELTWCALFMCMQSQIRPALGQLAQLCPIGHGVIATLSGCIEEHIRHSSNVQALRHYSRRCPGPYAAKLLVHPSVRCKHILISPQPPLSSTVSKAFFILGTSGRH